MSNQKLLSQMYSAALASIPLTIATLLPTAAQAIDFTGLYVFGDSLSDRNNVFQATQGLVPPEPIYADGRFSNGPIWVEQLAPKLGVTFNPQTDFAYGGATTGTLNTTVPLLPGLQQQIQGYVGLLAQTNTTADPNALYILWAGANDYLGGRQTNPTIPVSNLVDAVQALLGVGARNVLVANLPDLGTLPLTSTRPEAPLLSTLTQAHNSLLAQTLSVLRPNLAPTVNLFSLDVASLFSDAIANPTQYGFTNVTEACLFPSPLFFPVSQVSVCSEPDQYLFWDSLHPTTATHGFIAETAFQAINSQAVPEPPATLGLVTFGALLAGASALKRRQRQKAQLILSDAIAAPARKTAIKNS